MVVIFSSNFQCNCLVKLDSRGFECTVRKTSGVSVNGKSYKVDIRDWVKITRHTSADSWVTYASETMILSVITKSFKNYFFVNSQMEYLKICFNEKLFFFNFLLDFCLRNLVKWFLKKKILYINLCVCVGHENFEYVCIYVPSCTLLSCVKK